MNRNSSDRPVMISGMTSGAVTMPESSRRPRKRASALQRERDEGAERGREGRAHDRDAQAEQRGIEHFVVLRAGSRTSAARSRPTA